MTSNLVDRLHFGNVAALMLAALMLAGCDSRQGGAKGGPVDGGGAVSPSEPTAAPAVRVAGSEATIDLGTVAADSVHELTYVVENPSDQPLRFRTIRGDCECISAIDPPGEVPARSSAVIKARYVVPSTVPEYVSALLAMTDNPQRKVIYLKVRSKLGR